VHAALFTTPPKSPFHHCLAHGNSEKIINPKYYLNEKTLSSEVSRKISKYLPKMDLKKKKSYFVHTDLTSVEQTTVYFWKQSV